MTCFGDVLLYQEEAPRQTQDFLERLYVLAGLRTTWCPRGRAGRRGQEEGSLGFSALNLNPVKQEVMDGWDYKCLVLSSWRHFSLIQCWSHAVRIAKILTIKILMKPFCIGMLGSSKEDHPEIPACVQLSV